MTPCIQDAACFVALSDVAQEDRHRQVGGPGVLRNQFFLIRQLRHPQVLVPGSLFSLVPHAVVLVRRQAMGFGGGSRLASQSKSPVERRRRE